MKVSLDRRRPSCHLGSKFKFLTVILATNACGQRRAAPASCARLQSRQFPAHAGDARANQGLVADELEGEADQDRRESGEPRPLCCLPDGRGRHPTANVPEDSAAHCRTPAAAAACTSMRCSMVMRSRATEGRSASRCQQKWPDQPPRPPFGVPGLRPPSAPPGGLVKTRQQRKNPPRFGVHLGNPG